MPSQTESAYAVAKRILQQLDSENISVESKNIAFIRVLTMKLAVARGAIHPVITAYVAMTYLGRGLCQELSLRFAFEYGLATKKQDISLIMLVGQRDDNHCLIFIGKPNVPDGFLAKKGSRDLGLVMLPKTKLSLEKFIQANQGVFVDPLLNIVATNNIELEPLRSYCIDHAIDTVEAVEASIDNSITPLWVESTDAIQKNAKNIEKVIRASTLEEQRRFMYCHHNTYHKATNTPQWVSLNAQVIGGFITVFGAGAVALAFVALQSDSFKEFVIGLGVATALLGWSLFKFGQVHNEQCRREKVRCDQIKNELTDPRPLTKAHSP